jgi:hypothetical protein
MTNPFASPVFKLSIKEVLRERTWIAALVLLLVVPLFGYRLAPIHEDPSIAAPTRTQLAWIAAWIISVLWVNWWAASLSAAQRSRNHRTWWKGAGVSDSAYLFSLALVPILLNVAVFGTAMAVTVFTGRGTTPLAEWLTLGAQSFAAAVIGQSVITTLVVGIGNRFDAAATFAAGVLLNIQALYGVIFLDRLRTDRGIVSVFADALWTITPHLNLADFTSRLTFNWGSLPTSTMLILAAYLGGWLILSVGGAIGLFRYRP